MSFQKLRHYPYVHWKVYALQVISGCKTKFSFKSESKILFFKMGNLHFKSKSKNNSRAIHHGESELKFA